MEQNKQQMDHLLEAAAKSLGKDPALLQEQMRQGQFDQVFSGLPEEKRQQVNALLQDPKAMEAFIQKPQIQALLKALGVK